MSLRVRLTLLILFLFAMGMVVAVGRSLHHARLDLHDELARSQPLSTEIAEIPGSLQTQILALQVPAWFIALLDIDEDSAGDIAAHARIADRINALWLDTRFSVVVYSIAVMLISVLVYLLLGTWLRPVEQILNGLQEVEKGDFSRRIPSTGMPEFDQISDKINKLTTVLGASKQDNQRLQAEAIVTQEQQRRRLAQELHDSLGQAISAIKAMAVSIVVRSKDTSPEIAESAHNIERISDSAYTSVRDMMTRLRPAVLDELGLRVALQQMVDDWNVHHSNTFCRLNIDAGVDKLDENQSINVYRIVQEALTNVAKHANAEFVSVVLSGQKIISMTIEDDGQGFDAEQITMGMGLRGIQDRVALLQGSLEVQARKGRGVSLHIEFPRTVRHRRRKRARSGA